ncbi:MAG TPA: DUF4340 domain-containing protein [Vicinamibacterales bacterium]
MRGWSTLALGVVLVALVGFYYFLDPKRDPSASTEKKEKPFGSVLANDIEEVRVKTGNETARVQKTDGKWQLVEPEQGPADESELTSMTGSLASLEVNRIVDEKAADLKGYGLDPPRVEVSFRLKGQKDMKQLAIGEKTPTGGDLYARVPGQNRVFLVSSYLDSTFNKTPFALRDKGILKVERDKVDGLDLQSGTTQIQLAKKGSDWTLVKPIAARADFAAVEAAIERLSSAQMTSIINPSATPADLAKYGLDKPSSTMTVTSGSSRASLLLGKTENALVYAKDAARPMVFTVAPTVRDDVIKKIADFRRKDLFDGRSFTITHAEFKRGAETIVLDKSKGKDDKDVWKNGAGKDIDVMKAEDALNKVSGLRATSFEDKPDASLKTPALVVTFKFGENKTETVTFGKSGSDGFASRSDEPGSAKLDAMGLDEAMKTLDALK